MIFLDLPLRTFGQLSGVCQSWKAICGESLWKQVFHATFGTAPFLSLSWKERAKFCSQILDHDNNAPYTIWRAAMGLQHMIPLSKNRVIRKRDLALKVAVVGGNIKAIDGVVACYQVSLSYLETHTHAMDDPTVGIPQTSEQAPV